MSSQAQLAAVLLAAGPSSRLGQPKQLVSFDGQTLVRRMALLLADLQFSGTIVVSGCEAERVKAEVSELPVEVIYNPEWSKGMGGSIACAARRISGDADGALIIMCDQWRIDHADLSLLVDAWSSDISRLCVAEWQEGDARVSGPPVIFPNDTIPELKKLTGQQGARNVIDRHRERVEFVDMQNAAFDLDRQEDLFSDNRFSAASRSVSPNQ